MMPHIDQHIIRRCQHGDKDAFRLLMQTWQQMIYTLALRMLCDEDDAKDIVQETFIKVWVNIPSYDPEKSFHTWIYTIATRLCLDRLKHQARTCPLPEDEELLSDYMYAEDNTTRELESKELSAIIRTLVNQLSHKQRLVFTLICLEELSTQEVVSITGMSADQIKSNVYYARKNIQERLKQLGYEYDR